MTQQNEIFGISELEQMKNEYGIDIPAESVKLPSGGIFYPPDHPFHRKDSVLIRAMTARDEDILLNEAYAKQKTTLDMLISSCLVGKDRLPLEAKVNGQHTISSLLLGDRNALMLFIRLVSYGPEYSTEVKCPGCNVTNTTSFDLGLCAIHEPAHEPWQEGSTEFIYHLEKLNRNIRVRLPTVADEKATMALQERAKALKGKYGMTLGPESAIVTNTLKTQITAIEGKNGEWIQDGKALSQIINHIPAMDSHAIRRFIKECEPEIDMTQQFECTGCGFTGEVEMPIGRKFFWPDA